jgi:competence protein ComEC
VLRAEVLGFRALLTGDVEGRGERQLLERWPASALEADLLKVAHHGGRTSSDGRLLDVVKPRLAWISSGRANRYGHPSAEVLERLRARGIRALRTDRDGMILLKVEASGSLRLSRPGAPSWAAPGQAGRSR